MRQKWLATSCAVMCAGASLAAGSGERSLVEAARHADKVAVQALVQQRVDVNQSELDGTTALHWAVEHDDLETARLLVRAGANVGARNRYGVTPLYPAALNGNAAVLELLLEMGADPNTALPEGETALMTAARTGKLDAVTVLLARGADVNAREAWKGQTALMWAAAENHDPVVRALVDRGADLEVRSNGGFTPLLFAIRGGSFAAVRALLDAGADVNGIVRAPARSGSGRMAGNAMLMNGLSPLHVAIANLQYDIALYLLEKGAAPNADGPGWTPLHHLMWARRPNVAKARALPARTGTADSIQFAKALLGRGAKVDVRQTKELCIGGFADAGFQRLITPPDEPERAFWLPCNNDLNGARINLNRTGATPFLLAAQHADVEMMRLLLAHGADPAVTTTERQTALMVAAGVGIFGVGESPGTNEEALEAVKLMVELHADVNTVDANGDTALHGAALRGSNEIVQLLVDNGARLDVRNGAGWTPLTIAEGVLYTFTVKIAPRTAVLLRQLMAKQGIDVPAPASIASVQ
jgi:ankyrin repeat protein